MALLTELDPSPSPKMRVRSSQDGRTPMVLLVRAAGEACGLGKALVLVYLGFREQHAESGSHSALFVAYKERFPSGY